MPYGYFDLSNTNSYRFCDFFMSNQNSLSSGDISSGFVRSEFCAQSFRLSDIVPPGRLLNASQSRNSCLTLFEKLKRMETDSFMLTSSFSLVINRLSCQPKFQHTSDNRNELISSVGTLHQDAYSLCSTCFECMQAYKDWTCAMNFPFHNGSESPVDMDRLDLQCANVTKWCPLLVPIDLHSGQPFFLCTGIQTNRLFIRSRFCGINDSSDYCTVPFQRKNVDTIDSKKASKPLIHTKDANNRLAHKDFSAPVSIPTFRSSSPAFVHSRTDCIRFLSVAMFFHFLVISFFLNDIDYAAIRVNSVQIGEYTTEPGFEQIVICRTHIVKTQKI